MTFDDYQQQALVTEAPIDDGVRERFQEMSSMLQDILEGATGLEMADQIKKWIFYGKGNPDLFHTLARDYEFAVSDLPQDDETIRRVHAYLGIASEVPELAQAILNQDKVGIAEEIGDVLWYTGIGLDAIDLNMEMVAGANIAKLRGRYPDKFSQYDAQNRDIEWERESLESNLS